MVNLQNIKRVVIKIGSNILTDDKGLRSGFFKNLCDQVSALRQKKIDVVIVSSGAIATAMTELKVKTKPKTIPEKQAFAAIGQPMLMRHYAKVFSKSKMSVAQILITRDGIENTERALNARHAIDELLRLKVIPIVNENDTVTVDEIKIGDNDQLSAAVARLIDADILIILTHVDGLYDHNPKHNKNAQLIQRVSDISDKIRACVFEARDEKTVGGMATKLKAAEYCLKHDIPVVLTNGLRRDFIKNVFSKSFIGTVFVRD